MRIISIIFKLFFGLTIITIFFFQCYYTHIFFLTHNLHYDNYGNLYDSYNAYNQHNSNLFIPLYIQ
jgi:hypothetical protein